jgi:hypothetical protein
MTDNWWQSAPLAPASDPSFTGYIPGTPKPAAPKDRLDAESKRLDIAKKRQELGLDPPVGQTTATSDLSGDAYLATLDKPTGALVKALAEGRKSFPSGAALRNPYWQNILTHVSNFDPGFDETSYTQRAATRRSYFAGTGGPAKSIRALNTAIGHLGMLADQIDGTASHGFTPLNYVENTASQVMGNHGPTQFKQTAENLASELTAVYREAGGAEADIDRYIGQLSPNASEEQKRSAIGNTVKLLKSKLDALNYQYSQGMGVAGKDLPVFLDKHAEEVFKNYAVWADDPSLDPSGDGGDGKDATDKPGQTKLTPEQAAADRNFTETNPNATPEQYAGFLTNLLGMANKKVTPEAAAARLKGRREGRSFNAGVEDKPYEAKVRSRINAENKLGIGDTPADVLKNQGSQQGLSDEASGVGNALSGIVVAPFTGKLDPVSDYKFGRDVERQRIADARQQLGYGGSALEFVSSLGGVGPGARMATLTARQQAMNATAAGTVSGFGYGEGTEGSLTGAGEGALTGYVAGRAIPALAGKLGARQSPALAPELAAASDAEKVPLIRPMVDPASRGKFGELESHPASQNTIRDGVRGVIDAMESRVKALSPGTAASETDVAGQRAQTSLKGWLDTRQANNKINYGQARTLSGGKRFAPTQAVSEADGIISQLEANPNTNASELTFLKGLREDLAKPGGKTVDEIRKIREGLSNNIRRNGLTMDQEGVRALRILNAAKADIQTNVPAAASAYSKADRYYSATQPIVDDLERAVLGTKANPVDPQVAMKNLRLMMTDKATGRRFARIMGAMDTSTRQDVAATWAQALGRVAADDNFSARIFLTQTKDLSPSALRTAFGPEGEQSIKNLRVVARALRDSGSDINYSRSGSNVIRYMARNFLGRITGLGASAGTGFVAGGVEGAIAGGAGAAAIGAASATKTMLSARAMVNPKVSRWLADAAQVTNRTQAHTAMRKLSVIISRDPALASELQPVYDRISQAFSGPTTMPLAAQGEGQQNDQ